MSIKNIIPVIFAAIIIFFLFSLNAENTRLRNDKKLLRSEIMRVSATNDGLALALKSLEGDIAESNRIAATELKRLTELERKNEQIQTDIKNVLRSDKCAAAVVPAAAAERLRDAAKTAGGISGDKNPGSANPAAPDGAY